MCVCVKCPLTCLWSWMFFSLEMWEFWFFFRRSSIWSLMLFTCGTKQKGSHEDLGEAHSVDSPPPLKYTLVLYHCLTSDGGRRGGHRCMETASPPPPRRSRSFSRLRFLSASTSTLRRFSLFSCCSSARSRSSCLSEASTFCLLLI